MKTFWIVLIIMFSIVGVLLFALNKVFALTSGPNSGSTFTSDASIGTVAWNVPSRASASDNSRASAVMAAGETSEYLNSQGFGFTIPAGATINGILVEFEKLRSGSGNIISDASVSLLKAGTLAGSDYANAGQWPTSDTYVSYGGATDLWGTTWSVSDINNAGFGVVIAAFGEGSINNAQIDHVRITVTYTAAAVTAQQQSEFWFSNDDDI